MVKKTVTVENELGLHARPCSLIVKTATKFRSEFKIRKDDMTINGKSILGLMMLAAEYKSELEFIIDGVDEEFLLEELETLFKNKFDEE